MSTNIFVLLKKALKLTYKLPLQCWVNVGPEKGHANGQRTGTPLLRRKLELFSLGKKKSGETLLWPFNVYKVD